MTIRRPSLRLAVAFIVAVCLRAAATEIKRLSVEADPDGSGEVTCIVDADAGIATVRMRVTGPDGAEVAVRQDKAEFFVNWAAPETRKTELPFKVGRPRVWTDETPDLYGLRVELLGGRGELMAQAASRFAFCRREVRSDDGLYLNGQKIRLRGISAPVDSWPADETARLAVCRDAVREVRRLNANAIWCTNAPPAELLDLCDEAGLHIAGAVPEAEADRHPCVVAWRPTDGVRLVASPSHGVLRSWVRARQLTLACPLLPQQGAGGLGAGLADCWTAICAAPCCAGGILQAKGGWLVDGLGVHGPAIREIWSPVACSLSGRTLTFVNRNHFRGLDGYRYVWQALVFPASGERTLAEGEGNCPMARPGGSAQALLPKLPPDTQAVRLSVRDHAGEVVCSWSFRVERPVRALDWPVRGCAPPPGLEKVYLIAGARTNRVRNAKGRLMQSPQLYLFSPDGSSLKMTWGQMADGTCRLDYRLDCRVNAEILGFAFPRLEGTVGTRWLGRGPYRLWGNLRQGQAFGLWRAEPEACGFHPESEWMEIETTKGLYRFTVAKGTATLADGAPSGPDVLSSCRLPSFGPGVFLAIPGLGGEDFASNETGPAGCGRWMYHTGVHAAEGTLLITWKPAKP